MKAWTKRDDRLLWKYRAQGMYWGEVAELLNRSESTVIKRAGQLEPPQRRVWAPDELEFLQANYVTMTAERIGEVLRRPVGQVHATANRYGLRKIRGAYLDHKLLGKFTRAKLKLDWSDAEIAAAWTAEHPDQPLDRRYLAALRREKFHLPPSGITDRLRDRVRAKTREQLDAAGLGSLAELRRREFARYGERMGWPGVKWPRAVQILNVLYEQGPQSRVALAKKIGMRTTFPNSKQPDSRKLLLGNGPGGTYVATLIRMGLVVKLPGRPIRGKGKGRSFCVYAIAPKVQRSPIDAKQRKPEHPQPAGDRGTTAA